MLTEFELSARRMAQEERDHQLYLAVLDGDLKLVNFWLEYHANPLSKHSARLVKYDPIPITLLTIAVMYEHPKVVQRLLRIPQVRATAAMHANGPAREACTVGHLGILNMLLEVKEVANTITTNGNYQFETAVMNKHPHIVDRLLQFEAVRSRIISRGISGVLQFNPPIPERFGVYNRLLEEKEISETVNDYCRRKFEEAGFYVWQDSQSKAIDQFIKSMCNDNKTKLVQIRRLKESFPGFGKVGLSKRVDLAMDECLASAKPLTFQAPKPKKRQANKPSAPAPKKTRVKVVSEKQETNAWEGRLRRKSVRA